MKKNNLISIVVVSYNSSGTIIETLESIKKQTYKNIELIITDDSSKDNTVELSKKWLEENEERFSNSKIIKSNINTGITQNLNRGIKEAQGLYIKPIAADDILLESCIEDSVSCCLENKYEILYSKVIPFTAIGDKDYEKKLMSTEKIKNEFFELNAQQQNNELLLGFPIDTVGLFFSKNFIHKIGLFDEKYKMMEDYPFAYKVTSLGYKLNLLNKYEVKYRVRTPEENEKLKKTKRKENHISDLDKFRENEMIPELKKRGMYMGLYNLKIRMIEEKLHEKESKFINYFAKIFGFLSTKKIQNKIKTII